MNESVRATAWEKTQKSFDQASLYAVIGVAFFLPISTAATNVLLLLMTCFWLMGKDLTEKWKMVWMHPVSQVSLAVIFLFLLGTLYAQAPLQDIGRNFGKAVKLAYAPVLLYVLKEEKWRKRALYGFIFSIFLTFLLSFLNTRGYIDQAAYLKPSFGHSAACVFKDHITTNFFMAFTVFILAKGCLLSIRRGFFLWGSLLAGALLLTFYVFFMSEGRSGYVIFAFLFSLFLVRHFSWKGIFLASFLLLLLLGSAFFLSPTFHQRVQPVFQFAHQELQKRCCSSVSEEGTQTGDVSLMERKAFAKHSLFLIKKRPWLGWGTGGFQTAYRKEAAIQGWKDWEVTRNPHNEYLNIGLQLGLLGLVLVGVLYFVLFRLRTRLPPLEGWLAESILTSMAVGAAGNSWLSDFGPGYLFVFFLALSFSALPVVGFEKWAKRP